MARKTIFFILVVGLLFTVFLALDKRFQGVKGYAEIQGKSDKSEITNKENSNELKNEFFQIFEKYNPEELKELDSVKELEKAKDRLEKFAKDLQKLKDKDEVSLMLSILHDSLEEINYRINFLNSTSLKNNSSSEFLILKNKIMDYKPLFEDHLFRTKQSYQKYAKKLRNKIFGLVQYCPYQKTSLKPEVLERKEFKDYIREKISFQSYLGDRIFGYILIPKGVSLPAQGIIALHQHGGNHRLGADEVVGIAGDDEDQFYGLELVKRGYVVLAIDAETFGERIDREDEVDYLARWIGDSLFGMIIRNDIRSVDYMLTRSEVKSDKIGCIGFSMGGGRAIYLGALDKRINVVVSGGYVSSYKQLVKENMLFWPPSTWLPGILRYADCSGVVSLIAPRPLIIVNGRFDDSLSFQGMLDVYNKVERVYSFYKKEDNIKIFMLDEGHAFPKRVREKIYFWLGQWFGKNK